VVLPAALVFAFPVTRKVTDRRLPLGSSLLYVGRSLCELPPVAVKFLLGYLRVFGINDAGNVAV
jgi:hypothetical protein